MLHLKRAAQVAAIALLTGCTVDAAGPIGPDTRPSAAIGDGAHSGAVPGFYFLPPMVTAPTFSGTFDGGLAPTVQICELVGSACGPLVASFPFGNGAGAVKVNGDHYSANWNQTKSLDPARYYRIRVLVGTFELGFADVDVVETGSELSAVDTTQFVALKKGAGLAIKFRIETGIVKQVVVTPAADTINVGETAQFTATVYDLHGNPVSATPTWTSSNNGVATVDGSGLATGTGSGTVTITATVNAQAGTASLTVIQPNVPPVAAPDTFQAIGNLTVPVSAPGVLAGDTDPDANPLSVVPGPVTSAAGGAVMLNADGSFTYLSPAGFLGTDSFDYIVTDGIAADSATVTMQVPVRVWYVSNAGSAPGDGRDASPFTALSSAEAASAPGETIFLLYGNGTSAGYDQGITLQPSQSLTGQGVSANITTTLNGQTVTLLPAGSAPTVTRAAAGTTIQLSTGNVVQGLNVSSTAGAGMAGSGFVSLMVNTVSISAVGGPALDLQMGTATASFGALSSSGSPTAGVRLNMVGGSVSAPAGSITGAATGIDVLGGAGVVSYGGDVSGSGVRAVSVASRTGGSVALSGSITDAVGGILVQSNSGGSVDFTGPAKTLATAANPAVQLSGNTGASVSFAGGGLAITTTTGGGFLASGGGTVTVTGAGNTIASAGGTALSVTATGIGAAGMSFRSISAAGGANGIVLTGTGAVGGVQVTGDGATPASGGVITGQLGADGASAGNGVYLQNAANVTLRFMQMNDFANHAIRGVGVNGFTLASSVVNGVNGDNPALDEGSIAFDGLTGSASITATAISGGAGDNLRVNNSAGVLDRLTLNGVTVGANGLLGDRGVDLVAQGAAVFKVTVQGSTFTSARANLLHLTLLNSAVSDLVVSGTAFSNNHPAIAAGAGGVAVDGSATAQLTYQVSGNSFRDARGSALAIGQLSGAGSFSGTVDSNTIGLASALNSGSEQGSGISLVWVGGGSHTLAVTNNQVRQYNNQGILLQVGDASAGGTASIHATVTGNTIANPGTAPIAKNGFHLNSGTITGDAHGVCLALGGNALTGSGSGGAAGTDIRLRQRMLTTVRLPGYVGANNNNLAVQAFAQTNNGLTPTALAQNTVSTGGGGFVGGAACTLP